MFVHSLWLHCLLSAEQASALIRDKLEGFEQTAGDGLEFFMAARIERAEGADYDPAWTRPESTITNHSVVVYVLDPARLPTLWTEGAIVGAVSGLPAVNSALMDDLIGITEGTMIAPDLDRDRIASLPIYEARVVTGDGERSITYADPEHATSRFVGDWPGSTPLTAATIWHEAGVLLTAFSDGQLWLEGAAPDVVPEVVSATIARLWRR